MKRGEIWWADAGEPSGSEPGFRRPAVIVSANKFNRTPIKTVIILFLTASEARAGDPGNILLSSRQTGLARNSVANITQLGTVDKRILTERVGRVPDNLMSQIDDGLRLVLAL